MTVHERFMCHMKPSTCKKRHTYKLYNAVQKYGAENFFVETIEDNIPIEELDQKEISYIAKYDSYNNGYNSTPGGDGRIINKVNNEEKLLAMAQNGISAVDLADRFDVHVATVLRTLHKLGFYYITDKSEILKLESQGLTNREIADRLHCHIATVSRTLKKANKSRRKVRVDKRDNFDFDALFEDYNNQMPIDKLCEKYDISITTLSRIRKQYNIPTRKQIYKKKNTYQKCNDYGSCPSRIEDELLSEAPCNSESN